MEVYETYDKLTENIQAFAVSKEGEIVGKIVHITKLLKHIVTAHHIGHKMVMGVVEGYGYDVMGVALREACNRANNPTNSEIYAILAKATSNGEWQSELKEEGYSVVKIV